MIARGPDGWRAFRPRRLQYRLVRVLAPIIAFLLLPAAASAIEVTDTWRPHVHSAVAYAHKRAGVVAFDVRTPRHAYGWHARRRYHSASVVKAMLLVSYLNRRDVRSRRLHRSERRLLSPMIRRSDNAAASAIIGRVGLGGLRALARRAHMRRFTPVLGLWGLTVIDAEDQARFFFSIDHLLPPRHRAYAMRLLASVIPAQRWGIARVAPRGWKLFFKGGWGSGSGLVDHQVALLRRPHDRVSVAILTRGNPSHAYAQRTLRGVARRLLRGLGRRPTAPESKRPLPRDPNPCLDPVRRADLLCPRLTITKPYSMYLDRRPGGRRLLRATSSLNSVGLGPVELHGYRTGPNTMHATQRIYRRNGGHIKVRTGARLGFKSIPGQYRYWKLRDAARFELWSVDRRGRPVKRVRVGPKHYYCVRDLSRTHPSLRSPLQAHYPGCSQQRSARHVTLGTSVGWSDIYPATYNEQWIDVTGLHGRFRYVLIADPTGVIYTSQSRPARASRLVRIP
jgi:hypothetical protein